MTTSYWLYLEYLPVPPTSTQAQAASHSRAQRELRNRLVAALNPDERRRLLEFEDAQYTAQRRQLLEAFEEVSWLGERQNFEQGLFAAQPELLDIKDPLQWEFLGDEQPSSALPIMETWKRVFRGALTAAAFLSPLVLLINKARCAARG